MKTRDRILDVSLSLFNEEGEAAQSSLPVPMPGVSPDKGKEGEVLQPIKVNKTSVRYESDRDGSTKA